MFKRYQQSGSNNSIERSKSFRQGHSNNYGNPRLMCALSLVLLFVLMNPRAWGQENPVLPAVKSKGSYVVVVSAETAQQKGWMEVVTALRKKHDASLIMYPNGQLDAALPDLKTINPRFVAFVARPVEAGRKFVVAVHRMTRKLDNDPYTDVRWGIITGYDASDALRIATRSEPLIIRSAASSMGPGSFKNLDHGFASSETDKSKFWIKKTGDETDELKVDLDPVKRMVEAFNTQSPDMFVTSGHATEKNWQVIFNKNFGYFLCKDGQLFGYNSKKERFDINSPGVKIYLPMGNCLIGHIPERNCMALAWMHTGGVHQMFGYTAVTFHGYMGWGIGSFFNNQYDLSEAFHFNNQSLIWELQKLFPKQAGIEFNTFESRGINQLAAKHKIKDKKLMGHLWDRDVVAFYGDPAWEARHRIENPAWKATWSQTGETVEISVSVLKGGKWGNRPLAIPFPVRVGRIRGIDCSHDLKPLVTDDFALLPVMGTKRKAGDVITLKFGAFPIDSKATSAESAPRLATVGPTGAKPDATRFDPKSLGLPESETRRIFYACAYAKQNQGEIVKALQACTEDEKKDMAFVVTNMPLRDLNELSAEFLLENLRFSRKALAEAPWKAEITPELYQEYILPYANLSEKREPWRKLFYEKLKPVVADCKRPGEAAVKLNQTIYDLFNVNYHATKRPRPDQGPLESIAATYASCTGLSVLLVNACRAIGVPARVVGVAQWTKGPGNHTWVEVWDDGWHCLGASESKKLNGVWFGKGAAAADASDPLKRVYAATFSRGTVFFPLAWNPYATYVPAVDVTAWYKSTFGTTTAAKK